MRNSALRTMLVGLALTAGGQAAPAAGLAPLEFVERRTIADRESGLFEPSGLALTRDGSGFWTVSDDTARVFRLDAEGKVVPEASFGVDVNGLEGITVDPTGAYLLAVKEEPAEIVVISLEVGAVVGRQPLSEIAGYAEVRAAFEDGPSNKGLEGIAVDRGTGTVFVLKEQNPRLLIEIAPDLSAIRAVHRLTEAAGFRDAKTDDDDLDVSGIAHDPIRNAVWITSDTGRMICLYDLGQRTAECGPMRWDDDGRKRLVRNAEGVAVDPAGGHLYVVTDDGKSSSLFVYALQP